MTEKRGIEHPRRLFFFDSPPSKKERFCPGIGVHAIASFLVSAKPCSTMQLARTSIWILFLLVLYLLLTTEAYNADHKRALSLGDDAHLRESLLPASHRSPDSSARLGNGEAEHRVISRPFSIQVNPIEDSQDIKDGGQLRYETHKKKKGLPHPLSALF